VRKQHSGPRDPDCQTEIGGRAGSVPAGRAEFALAELSGVMNRLFDLLTGLCTGGPAGCRGFALMCG
jgi:hypothetical protein